MARQLSGQVDGLKIGMEFFYAHGAGYRKLADANADISRFKIARYSQYRGASRARFGAA